MGIIQVFKLHKIYRVGESIIHALAGVSLSVKDGEFIAITGKSGSGKSTLLHMFAGLEPVTSGEIVINTTHIEGLNESELTNFRREHIGFIFQSFNLIPSMTSLENVALPLVLRGYSKERRLDTAASMLISLGLEKHLNHTPQQMSGGQQQRVGIARALVTEPAIIFADEPTGNLDSQNSEEIIKFIRSISENRGQTVLMVTHDSELANKTDRIMNLRDGRIFTD